VGVYRGSHQLGPESISVAGDLRDSRSNLRATTRSSGLFSLYVGTPTYAHDYSTMTERAQACRRKANECELAARLSRQVEMRLMYRDLAQLWREMASEMEQFEEAKQQPK